MSESRFVYVIYIRTTPARLWSALTDPDFVRQYWFGMHHETDWQPGSAWRLMHPDGRVLDAGRVLEADPPNRLVLSWRHHMRPELADEGEANCVITLEPAGNAVKLSITHTINVANSKVIEAVSGGWPKILSNLKSLLETGTVLLPPRY